MKRYWIAILELVLLIGLTFGAISCASSDPGPDRSGTEHKRDGGGGGGCH